MKILIVDDHIMIAEGIKAIMVEGGFSPSDISTAQSAQEAGRYLDEHIVDLLITDIRLPNAMGFDLIEGHRKAQPGMRTILISAHEKFEYAKRAMRLDVVDYLLKPIDRQELYRSLARMGLMPQRDSVEDERRGDPAPQTRGVSMIIQEALDYIDKHYGDPNLSMTYITNQLSRNYNYFSIQFKQEMGMSFGEYLNAYRIRKAKPLLMDFDLTIRDVTLTVGFTEVVQFHKVFKRITGTTPGCYRNSVMGTTLIKNGMEE